VDDTIDRIKFAFDDYGRPVSTSSIFKGMGDEIANQMEYEYDTLGNLVTLKQNPIGEVDASTSTGTVEYEYDIEEASFGSAVSNYSRLKWLRYPMGTGAAKTQLLMVFNGTATLDARLSRIAGYNWSGAGGALQYRNSHVGLGTPVLTKYREYVGGAQTRWTLDRWVNPDLDNPGSGADTDQSNGLYYGLDRFGRVARQVWHKGTAGTDWDPDIQPAAIDYAYDYSKASEVLNRYDRRAGGKTLRTDGSEAYFYDGLNRLVEAKRGAYDQSVPSFTVAGRSQAWELDMLGNWGTTSIDEDGNGSYATAEIDTRDHNRANELVDRLSGTRPFGYDDNGNRTSQRTDLQDELDKGFVYDAWNRLVKVSITSSSQSQQYAHQERAEFTYYPGNQRATSMLK